MTADQIDRQGPSCPRLENGQATFVAPSLGSGEGASGTMHASASGHERSFRTRCLICSSESGYEPISKLR
jgi:hypothetical protein